MVWVVCKWIDVQPVSLSFFVVTFNLQLTPNTKFILCRLRCPLSSILCHSAFRLKQNYKLTHKQLNNKSDKRESQIMYSLRSDQENNTDASVIQRKRAYAFKTRRRILWTNKKLKRKESERQERLDEESQNKDKPDLEETTDISEGGKNESEFVPKICTK